MIVWKGNRCNIGVCKKFYNPKFLATDEKEINCDECEYAGVKGVEVDPKKPYWFIYIHRLNEEHPEVLGSYDYSDFVTSLENASKESGFDYAEMYCLFDGKTRIVADIQKEGVKVFQPFADMIDWKSVEKD